MDRGSVILEGSEPRLNGFFTETKLTADPHSRQRMLAGELIDAGLGNLQGFRHFIRFEQPHVTILQSVAIAVLCGEAFDRFNCSHYTQPLEYVNTEPVDYSP